MYVIASIAKYQQRPWSYKYPKYEENIPKMIILFRHQRKASHFDELSSASLAMSLYKNCLLPHKLSSQLQT